MNKWLYFIGGLLSGVILSILFLLIIGIVMFQNNEEIDAEENTEMTLDDDDDITYFDEPRDIIKESSVKVIQVIARDAALVNGDSNLAGGTSLKGMYLGPVYLISWTNNTYLQI